MRNDDDWNKFTRTGRVSDYLTYTGNAENRERREEDAVREERGQREGTCDGNGAFSSYHW